MKSTLLYFLFLIFATHCTFGVINISMQEVGSDLFFSYSGNIDLSGLSNTTGNQTPGFANAGSGGFDIVQFETSGADYYDIGSTTYTTFGGSSFIDFASNITGDVFGFRTGLTGPEFLMVPPGYISRTPIAGSMLFLGTSLADLDLFSGASNTYTLANGDQIVWSAVPEPSTAAHLATVFAIVLGLRRRRQ